MKASELLERIQDNLKGYPIDYLRNKATDDRYRDSITKKLAEYNVCTYGDIHDTVILDDFEIKDSIIENIVKDIEFYFDRYDPGDIQTCEFTKNISLYLILIAKKPLHPYSENKKDEIFLSDGTFYCKGRIKHIHDERSLCRYCVCKNLNFREMF